MRKIAILLLATACSFAACDIERLPYGSMAAEQITGDPDGSLESLLNGCYAQMKDWSDVMHRCGEYAGDNIVIRGTSTDAFYEFISYSRTPNNYRLQTFWDNSYKIVAQSSNIIKMIGEGQSTEVDHKLGECYFLRGMMYFYLCRAYGRPYAQSPETNLGVPIVNGTPDDMLNLQLPDRATVKATYEQIVSDLKKGEALMTLNKGAIFASKEAAQALLSRVYLYMSGTYSAPNTEYAKLAVDYADKVIQSPNYSLLPFAEFKLYNTKTPANNKESIFVVRRLASEFSGFDHYYGVGGMYSNIGGMGWGEMYASGKYIALLDETGRNDWANNKLVDARAAFVEPQYEGNVTGKGYKLKVFRFIKDLFNASGVQTNFSYVQASVKVDETTGEVVKETNGSILCWEGSGVDRKEYFLKPKNANQGVYTIDYTDGKTYTGVIDNQMKLNRAYPMFYIVKCSREGEDSQLHSPVITRLGEVYLNRAEALAKQGKYGEALLDLNKIRERSLPGEGYASIDATSAKVLIDKERQLELAYQAERSYDVFRNGESLTRLYPGPHNAMEEVKSSDFRVVYYIPQKAINSYPGTLTQNPTSN